MSPEVVGVVNVVHELGPTEGVEGAVYVFYAIPIAPPFGASTSS